jgi:predicted alpha/beta-hydrolase family hydrolase
VAPQPVDLHLASDVRVSGLIERPANARALFVMAHGAGAGMRHIFLGNVSDALAERGIASLRYQFPYMEQNGRRPDPPALCHRTVRAAVAWAGEFEPALPLIAGGKSFGGRMTSQTQGIDPLPGVRGLAFLGFPLHPPKKPSLARAEHLAKVLIPMVFLQGTRDALADIGLARQAIEGLGARARLIPLDGADHAFHVPARSGRTDADVLRELADAVTAWIDSIIR